MADSNTVVKKVKTKNPKTDDFITTNQRIEYEPEDDEMGRRIVEVDGEEKFTVVQKDPFALWYIKNKSNKVPKQLSGMFTSIGEAEKAINSFVNAKNYKG